MIYQHWSAHFYCNEGDDFSLFILAVVCRITLLGVEVPLALYVKLVVCPCCLALSNDLFVA